MAIDRYFFLLLVCWFMIGWDNDYFFCTTLGGGGVHRQGPRPRIFQGGGVADEAVNRIFLNFLSQENRVAQNITLQHLRQRNRTGGGIKPTKEISATFFFIIEAFPYLSGPAPSFQAVIYIKSLLLLSAQCQLNILQVRVCKPGCALCNAIAGWAFCKLG